MDLKIEHIELENRMRDEEGPVVVRRVPSRSPHKEEQAPARHHRTAEGYFSLESLRRLMYRAVYLVLSRDPWLREEELKELMSNLWPRMQAADLTGVIRYLDGTMEHLWQQGRISRESYDVLQPLRNVRRRNGKPEDAGDLTGAGAFSALSRLLGVAGVDEKS